MKKTSSSVAVIRRSPASLTRADRDRIEQFIRHHSDWKREHLDEVLDASTYVWLCQDEAGRIVGTTAVRRLEAQLGGRAVTVIYTAVVAVDHAYRRLGLVPRMGMKSYLVERLRTPLRPIYWLALAGSPAGYAQMARNFVTYWPRPGVAIPDGPRAVLEQSLAALGARNIVEVEGCYVLRDDDFGVLDKDQDPERWNGADPDAGFFFRVNPEYRSGHDLACLCPLGLVPLAKALVVRALFPTRRTASRFETQKPRPVTS
ncbi:MAG: GNAT family N-acetyltransferase [Minicystis sp.]